MRWPRKSGPHDTRHYPGKSTLGTSSHYNVGPLAAVIYHLSPAHSLISNPSGLFTLALPYIDVARHG
jgi:hypothetical protein